MAQARECVSVPWDAIKGDGSAPLAATGLYIGKRSEALQGVQR